MDVVIAALVSAVLGGLVVYILENRKPPPKCYRIVNT